MSPTLLWMLLTMATTDDPNAVPAPTPAPAAACTDPAYRQFDFWLGEWTVQGKAGKTVGRSRIESVLGGCAIAETWTSGSGPANDGTSLNRYDAATRQWEQYWVDAQGGRLFLREGMNIPGIADIYRRDVDSTVNIHSRRPSASCSNCRQIANFCHQRKRSGRPRSANETDASSTVIAVPSRPTSGQSS